MIYRKHKAKIRDQRVHDLSDESYKKKLEKSNYRMAFSRRFFHRTSHLILVGCAVLLIAVFVYLAVVIRSRTDEDGQVSLYEPVTNDRVWMEIVRLNQPVDVPLRQNGLKDRLQTSKAQYFNISAQKSDSKIPRNIHFVRISSTTVDVSSWQVQWSKPRAKPLHLIHYLTLRAAISRLNPDRVFFYCDIEPTGPLWHLIRPLLTIVLVTPESNIFGNDLTSVTQLTDILRMRALMQHGGVYLDLDIITLDSLKDLFDSDSEFILGKEEGYDNAGDHFVGICSAVLLGRSESKFLRRWYRSYTRFDSDRFYEYSGKIPWQLSRMVPDNVTVLDADRLFTPLWTNEGLETLFVKAGFDWSKNYAVHLWGQMSWHSFLAPLSFHNIVAIDTSLHKLLRPLLPYPLFTMMVYCESPGEARQVMKTISSILSQQFQLYDILVGDTSPDSKCTTLLENEFLPAHSRLLLPGVISIMKKPGATKDIIRTTLEYNAKGAWMVETATGKAIHPEMLLQAQDFMVSNPGSYLDGVDAFRAFKFRYADPVQPLRSKTLPLPNQLYFPKWYGPFPEMNPNHIPLSEIHSGQSDVFSVVVLDEKALINATDHSAYNLDKSRRLRLHSALRLTAVSDVDLWSMWPAEISAGLYRSVALNLIETSAMEAFQIKHLLLHVKVWEKCVQDRQPVLVLTSRVKVSSEFDAQIKLALRSLPLDFGFLYFGGSESIYSGRGEKVVHLYEVDTIIDDFDAFLISPRMAQMLLDDAFPLAMPLDRYFYEVAHQYRFRIFRTNSPLVSSYKRIPAEMPRPASTRPRFIHVMHLNTISMWYKLIPGLPQNGGSMMSGFNSFDKKHWTEATAQEEDIFYSDLDPLAPLYDLKVLHLKLTILVKYGGVIIDSGFGSDRLPSLPESLPMFWAVFQSKGQKILPKIPLMAAPKNTASIAQLRTDLHDIISGPEPSEHKHAEAIDLFESFLKYNTSSFPRNDKIVVVPISILFE